MINDLINLDKLFKELEWLSSESRQILLSRMAIRTLPFLFEFASKTKDEFFGPERLSRCILDIFRIVISVTSNAHDKTSLTVQAPIVPALTPSHVSLKFKGNDSALFWFEHARSQEFYIGYSDYELGYNGNPMVALVSGADQKISLEEIIRVFFEETKVVYQNLTLSDRTISKGSARSIANLPLWTFAENNIQEVAFHDFLKPIENYIGADLQFWSNWLAGLQSGDQLPFELQKRVAQIPDKIWEDGFEAVAEAIEGIERDYLLETTQTKEDPAHAGDETARYDGSIPKLILSRTNVVPALVKKPKTEKLGLPLASGPIIDPIAFQLANIEAALNYAIDNCAKNGFSSQSSEATFLNSLTDLPNEARYVAPRFHQVHCMLERKFANGEYFEEDPLTFLNNQLKAAVLALVEIDPTAKDHIESYGALPEPEPLSSESISDIQEADEVLGPIVEDDARAVISEVAERLEPGKAPSKYEWALLAQWLAQIWLYLEKAKKHSGIAEWIWKILEKIW